MTQISTDQRGPEDLCSSASSVDHSEFLDLGMSETTNAMRRTRSVREPSAKKRILIVDLGLAGGDGLELVKDIKIRHPKIPALVLSMHDESLYAERAYRAGASGVVTKQAMSATVLIAIHHVLDGESEVHPKVREKIGRR